MDLRLRFPRGCKQTLTLSLATKPLWKAVFIFTVIENPYLGIVGPRWFQPMEILICKDLQIWPSSIGFGNPCFRKFAHWNQSFWPMCIDTHLHRCEILNNESLFYENENPSYIQIPHLLLNFFLSNFMILKNFFI